MLKRYSEYYDTKTIKEYVAGNREHWHLAGDNLFVDLDLSIENLPAGTYTVTAFPGPDSSDRSVTVTGVSVGGPGTTTNRDLTLGDPGGSLEVGILDDAQHLVHGAPEVRDGRRGPRPEPS